MSGIVAYAPGSGRGHTTRAAGILRLLPDVETLVVRTTGAPEPLDGCGLAHVPATHATAANVICDAAPDLLLVDCFPVGFRQELIPLLRDLRCPKVLIWRGFPAGRRLGLEAGLGHYDRIFRVEGNDAVAAIDCPPVFLRDDHELLSRHDARRLIGAGPDDVVIAAVRPNGGADRFDELVAAADVPLQHIAHDPLLEVMNGLDGLIGTAGYNLFHEVRATGVPARFTWREGPHDQRVRCPIPADPAEVTRWGRSLAPRSDAAATYDNGAHRIAHHLRRLLGG